MDEREKRPVVGSDASASNTLAPTKFAVSHSERHVCVETDRAGDVIPYILLWGSFWLPIY